MHWLWRQSIILAATGPAIAASALPGEESAALLPSPPPTDQLRLRQVQVIFRHGSKNSIFILNPFNNVFFRR
jgi:hypothetical protein